jgi:hypothetical protein
MTDRKPNLRPLKTSWYSPEDYERLNHLNDGEDEINTDTLISKLAGNDDNHKKNRDKDRDRIRAKNLVKCRLRVFRIMRDIEKEIIPITRKELKKNPELLLNLDSNAEIARRIKAGYLIAPVTEVKEIIENEQSIGHLRGKSKHRPPDYPLNILIFLLREHLKNAEKKINNSMGGGNSETQVTFAGTTMPRASINSLISGFLGEQKIQIGRHRPDDKDNSPDDDLISKRLKRHPIEKLREAYDFFQTVYGAPALLDVSPNEAVLSFDQQMRLSTSDEPQDEWDVFFPTWNDSLKF